MKKRRSGSIVSTSTINAFFPDVGTLAYSASEASIIGFSNELCLELARINIRINVVCSRRHPYG